MGRGHLQRLLDHPRAEVVAVCDRDERRRRGDARDTSGSLDVVSAGQTDASFDSLRAYATPEELIGDAELDAVLIALPTPLHAPVAAKALHTGKHVFCEKPMGYRPADCDRMIRAHQESGRTLMIGQCLRFWPQYEKIRELIEAGRIGRVQFATLQRIGSPPTYSADNWLLDAEQSGGALLDLHVHDVDFAQRVFGLPASIHARGKIGPSGGFDHVVASWGYPGGCYVVIEGGWMYAAPYPFDMAITVHGETGTLSWRMTAGDDVLCYAGGVAPESIAVAGDPLRQELDYFISCVLDGRTPDRCTPKSTRASIVLAWLERRAIETGRVVEIGERLRTTWSK